MSSSSISDYALIGNCRSAALVGHDGSIDWLCWPRYDSPSLFGALLDESRGGRFSIHPTGPFKVSRRYVRHTNVLETIFETSSGRAVLRDCLTVVSPDERDAELLPEHELLRELDCTHGEIEIVYEPRPDYARVTVHLENRGTFGLWLQYGGAVVILRTEAELNLRKDGTAAVGYLRRRGGERTSFALTYNRRGPAVLPLLGLPAQDRLGGTIRWWRSWANRCTYDGDYREDVIRSALVLKLMTYAPSGAVIAAPTTSFARACRRELELGLPLLLATRCVAGTPRAVRTRLSFGGNRVRELDAPGNATDLAESSGAVRRVRRGPRARNKAAPSVGLRRFPTSPSRQRRVAPGATGRVRRGDRCGRAFYAGRRWVDQQAVRLLDDLGQTVCRRWRQPDAGIWERRGPLMHHTHSKVMCWVALDRLVRLHKAGHIDVHLNEFEKERAAIRSAIEQHGYSSEFQTYTSTLGGTDVDASLLLLPVYGYVSADNPRMRRTTDLVLHRLSRGCLVWRHENRDWRREGAFGACSFWAVAAIALSGDVAAAIQSFDCLLGYANDVGLYGEEIDPDTKGALGNFPQAFSHVGLINAALTLQAGCAGQGDRR